jgi:DNA modification methylase
MNSITRGDCVEVMKSMPAGSVDFILTDPPYLVRYCDRSGRTVKNDNNDAWIDPAFAQMHRVLKNNSFCVSFYAWNKADRFIDAWKKAGFHMVGHVVFTKKYSSSARFMGYQHEQAYLLAKGNPAVPANPPPDVIPWTYTGNRSGFSRLCWRPSPSPATSCSIPSQDPAAHWWLLGTWAAASSALNWTKRITGRRRRVSLRNSIGRVSAKAVSGSRSSFSRW